MKHVVIATFLMFFGLPVLAQNLFLCPEAVDDTPEEIKWHTNDLVPGIDDWLFVEWDLRTEFDIPSEFHPLLQRLSQALAAKGTRLIALPVPSRGMHNADKLDWNNPVAARYSSDIAIQNYYALHALLNNLGIDSINPMPYMIEDRASLNFKRDLHWTPTGASKVALAASDYIRNLPEFAYLPASNASLEVKDSVFQEGIYAETATRLCETAIPNESYTRYQIITPQVGLLEETPKVEIMVLGTSFSSDKYSFGNFLYDNLDKEVSTLYTNGGSNWYSLERLFLDPNLTLPQILVWEFPAESYELWELGSLRSLLPMAEGACSLESSLIKQDTTIDTNSVLIDVMSRTDIQGSQHYLVLDIPDTSVREFGLNLNYQNGETENFYLQRDDRVENYGQFMIELSDQISFPLASVTFQNVNETPYLGSVSTRVCRTNSF